MNIFETCEDVWAIEKQAQRTKELLHAKNQAIRELRFQQEQATNRASFYRLIVLVAAIENLLLLAIKLWG